MPSDSPRPRRRPRLGPFLVLLSLLAACATGTDTRALRELTPAALVVVVDAVPPAAAAGGPLQFTATAAEMQSMLAAELRVLGLGSRVVARQDLGKDEADIVLTLTPRRPIEFAHRGVAAAGNVIGSAALWVVTWIGGLLVPDSNYTIGMDASAAVAMPGLERAGFDLPVKGGDVDLTFFDRNQFFSWPLVQSFVLPSFLTTDQAAVTSASLTRACMHEAAVQITAQLQVIGGVGKDQVNRPGWKRIHHLNAIAGDDLVQRKHLCPGRRHFGRHILPRPAASWCAVYGLQDESLAIRRQILY